eukprot:TRINITY_DN110947_c0_g1_i1.p1 TRINITY_DN110947_c0_g1~~TRINITY_DN110947_c0_g1_i1.p1  ORF type:complete len:581 (-),score=100.91 TRINITY_DN110947_c0_g1_i1:298-1995(-)
MSLLRGPSSLGVFSSSLRCSHEAASAGAAVKQHCLPLQPCQQVTWSSRASSCSSSSRSVGVLLAASSGGLLLRGRLKSQASKGSVAAGSRLSRRAVATSAASPCRKSTEEERENDGDARRRDTGSSSGNQLYEELPRVDVSSLRPGELLGKLHSPVVLTGLAECWPARHCWSLDYLAKVHGDIPSADLTLPEEVFAGDALGAARGQALYADHLRSAYVPFVRQPQPVSLGEFIQNRFNDYHFEISEHGAAGRLCRDCFGGVDRLPELLAADDLSQLTFGIGPKGEGVMLHAHTAVWNALMFGEKEWFFYRPNELVGAAYDALGLVDSGALIQATTDIASSSSRAPQLYRCRQRAGEVVYAPDGWWHATVSHTDTACLGGQRHKDHLPACWAEELLARWPGCGLAMVAVAKSRNDSDLFEEAMRREPFNMRFVAEYIDFASARREYRKAAEAALHMKSVLADAQQRQMMSKVEVAAILAQLAERLYQTVETAASRTSELVTASGELPGSSSRSLFQEMIHVSQVTHSLLQTALTLDAGAPLAINLLQAIEMRSKMADVKNIPEGLL